MIPPDATAMLTYKEPDALEPETQLDIFANEEVYVGVNNEHIYASVPDARPSTQPYDSAQASCPDRDEISDEGDAYAKPKVNDAGPQEINVLYDPENPRIEKDALFPNMITFRKAIRHYVVKKSFEFTGLQTDKTRFIAKCAAKGCPWHIHASRIYDEKTIEVCHHVLMHDT